MDDEKRKVTGFLDDWSLVVGTSVDVYSDPARQCRFLRGTIFHHKDHIDGKNLSTSCVVKIDGRFITTKSGSVYELGEPVEEYVDWCKQTGCHIPTEKEPIRILL